MQRNAYHRRDLIQIVEEKRYCRKCLLKDFDEDKYHELVKKELDWMDEEMKAPDELYAQRLAICEECDRLNQGTCLACGCFVELRAAARKAACPKKKW